MRLCTPPMLTSPQPTPPPAHPTPKEPPAAHPATAAMAPSLAMYAASSAGHPCCSDRASQSDVTMWTLPHLLAALELGKGAQGLKPESIAIPQGVEKGQRGAGQQEAGRQRPEGQPVVSDPFSIRSVEEFPSVSGRWLQSVSDARASWQAAGVKPKHHTAFNPHALHRATPRCTVPLLKGEASTHSQELRPQGPVAHQVRAHPLLQLRAERAAALLHQHLDGLPLHLAEVGGAHNQPGEGPGAVALSRDLSRSPFWGRAHISMLVWLVQTIMGLPLLLRQTRTLLSLATTAAVSVKTVLQVFQLPVNQLHEQQLFQTPGNTQTYTYFCAHARTHTHRNMWTHT